jgi:hypothetical protein
MRIFQLIFAAGLMLIGLSVQAEVSEEEFNELKAQYADLAEKVDGKSDISWADRIAISGDFRFRYENIEEEGEHGRHRSRIRARTAIKASMPNVEIGIGLGTGGNDPVSSNVTLGEGGSSKDIRLDLAYASWMGLSNTVVTLGKFKNPLIRVGGNGLLWDADWRPEGMTAGWGNEHFFGTAIGSWLEGDSKKGSEYFWGLQGGVKGELIGTSFTAGVSFFDMGTAGAKSAFGDVDDFFGNSFTCTDMVTPDDCTYNVNYEEIEVFAEAATKIAGQTVKFFADFVRNQDAKENDTGWALGIKVGKVKDLGQWAVGYLYQDLEADAVLGLVTDSDFGGGGTDSRGHKISVAYGMNKSSALKATYFINENNVASGNPRDFDRLQLDIQFKFK